MKKNIKLALGTYLLLSLSSLDAANELTGLGYLNNVTTIDSITTGISSDGSIVVGYDLSDNGVDGLRYEAFRWTEAEGMVGLGDLAGGSFLSNAYGVNSNGTVIVGMSDSTNGNEAFRWTQAGGMVGLGDLAGGAFLSSAYGISSDGSVIIGKGTSANGTEAFRWTQAGGMVGLGDLAGGGFHSVAYGVNSDGSVIVGTGVSANGNEAFRWTQAAGMIGLGDLAGGVFLSEAKDVSSDGSIIVGKSVSANGVEAFRWTQAAGMLGLGDLAGGVFSSTAYGMSSDGSVIIGQGTSVNGNEAFRWTETTGMQSISEWLAEDGYVLSGWTNTSARDVSDDGNVIVGYGTSANGTEAFIARGGSGLIGMENFTTSLESINSVTAQGVSFAQTAMHGAHGHPGQNRALDEKTTMWVAGDIAYDNHHESKDHLQLAEVGVSYKLNENFTFSGALGKMWNKSTLVDSGDTKGHGKYFAIDTDIRFSDKFPLYLTLSYLYGDNDTDVKRGYDNAGSNDASYGSTSQNIQAIRTRLQYQSAKEIKTALFHPYIEYNALKVKTDAYTETGGGFPAIFDESTETVHDFRLGFDADYALASKNRIITTAEAVHRTDERGSGISGQIVGLSSFDINGREYEQNWLRGTLGLEHTFDVGRLTVTLNISSEGEDPHYWSGVNTADSYKGTIIA